MDRCVHFKRPYVEQRPESVRSDAAGERIVDAKGRPSYVTSAGSAPSLQQHVLLAYLPPELAVPAGHLSVEYMSERFPVTVAVAGATPLFDPENARVRS